MTDRISADGQMRVSGGQAGGEPEAVQSTELVTISALVPAVIFAKGGADDVLAQLRKMVAAVKTDISTPKGRAAVKSLAYKIARSKTALDNCGKELGDQLRAQLDPILEERRKIREGCDALAEEVKAPLTAWEAQEAERIKAHETALIAISGTAQFFSDEPTSEEIRARIADLDELTVAPYNWQEFIQRAIDAKADARRTLTDLLEHTVSREAAEAEAARLAAEQEAARLAELARQQAEREAEIARQAAETARLAAEQEAARIAEETRLAAEQEAARVAEVARIKRERIQREADEAAQAAEAERQRIEQKAAQDAADAAAERQRLEDEKQRLIDEAAAAEARRLAEVEAARLQKIADDAAAEVRAGIERDRAKKEQEAAVQAERDRAAAVQRQADAEKAEREADKENRAKVNRKARDYLISKVGLSADHASAVVKAIALGQVPGVKIEY